MRIQIYVCSFFNCVLAEPFVNLLRSSRFSQIIMTVLASWPYTKVSRDACAPVEREHRLRAVRHGGRVPQRRTCRSAGPFSASGCHLRLLPAHVGEYSVFRVPEGPSLEGTSSELYVTNSFWYKRKIYRVFLKYTDHFSGVLYLQRQRQVTV
jgi:hypothetical protein